MRSKIILVLAIVMGLITTVLFYKYMGTFNEAPGTTSQTISVIVAKEDISKNVQITMDMITKIEVAESSLYSNVMVSPVDVVGKYTLADIAQGEPFLSHRVMSEQDEKIFVSRKITEGERGVSVGLNFVQSVSNLIEPEDYVDVIFTKLGKPELGIETVSQILLKNVRVLAVGRKMIETVDGEDYVEYSSATLEMDAAETVKVVNAGNDGILTLTLHSRIQQNGTAKQPEEGKGNVQ